MPSAMQNDVYLEHAKKIAQAGVKYYIEVANMPTTNDALRYLMDCGLIVAPSKAVNAGGVATSALEMAQNSERMVWTAQEVDKQLREGSPARRLPPLQRLRRPPRPSPLPMTTLRCPR